MPEMVHTKHLKNSHSQDQQYLVLLSSEMMVESSPMWMGMDLSVSKDEKESLSAIMWFKALESIKSALDFYVLSMRA